MSLSNEKIKAKVLKNAKELHEEKRSLSDKIICMKHNYKHCELVYPEEDVKEAVKKIMKRIDNPSGQVNCSVRMIFQIIKEKMGDKLI